MVHNINSRYSITFDDVLLSPDYSEIKPKDTNTSIKLSNLQLHIPIISSAMDTVTESKMAIGMALQGGIGVVHRNTSIPLQAKEIQKVKNYKISKNQANRGAVDSSGKLLVGGATGVENNAYDRMLALLDAGADGIFVDVAHAHTKTTIDFIKKAKKKLKQIPLIVGNIATKEAALALIKVGVDAIKVGIGPGSICTTRIVTGVGVPQLSAIIDVFSVANKYKIPVIADGGIKTSADIAKAIAGGASVCMVGSLLAGTDESPGKKLKIKDKYYKSYRGMGSIGAMQRGSFDRYSQEETKNKNKLVAEGVEGMVP